MGQLLKSNKLTLSKKHEFSDREFPFRSVHLQSNFSKFRRRDASQTSAFRLKNRKPCLFLSRPPTPIIYESLSHERNEVLRYRYYSSSYDRCVLDSSAFVMNSEHLGTRFLLSFIRRYVILNPTSNLNFLNPITVETAICSVNNSPKETRYFSVCDHTTLRSN